MKYCKNCGGEINSQDKFCSNCGIEIREEERFDTFESNYKVKDSYSKPQTKEQSKYYLASSILGIGSILVAIFLFGGIFYPRIIGLVLGVFAVVLALQDKKNEGSYSQVGLTTGFVGIALALLSLILNLLFIRAFF